MGKIILEFDSIADANEAQTAIDADKWKAVVWDIDQQLRQTTKYNVSILNGDASDLEIELATKYRELISTILENYNLRYE